MLLQGIFWLRSLIQIKLGLMAFFGVYAIGMMTLRNTSDCQPMSPMGQKQTFRQVQTMSALPPKADINQHGRDGRTKRQTFSSLAVKRSALGPPHVNGLAAFCKMIPDAPGRREHRQAFVGRGADFPIGSDGPFGLADNPSFHGCTFELQLKA